MSETTLTTLVALSPLGPGQRRRSAWWIGAAMVLIAVAAIAVVRWERPASVVVVGPAPSSITEVRSVIRWVSVVWL